MANTNTLYSNPVRDYEGSAFLTFTHETDSLDYEEIDNLLDQIRERLVALRADGCDSFSAIVILNDCVEQRRVAANILGGMLVAACTKDDISFVDDALNTPEQLAVAYSEEDAEA